MTLHVPRPFMIFLHYMATPLKLIGDSYASQIDKPLILLLNSSRAPT